jgi:putative peptide zinc metalloprotease protein
VSTLEINRTERVLGPLAVGVRSDVQVTRQHTRGGPRYVLHDPVTFQNHALGVHDYRILCAITRHRTLGETHRELVARGLLDDSDADRQGFYRFVLWLHGAGLLRLPITGGETTWEHSRKRRSAQRGPWYQIFLSHRIPLWNPDRFLQRTLRWGGFPFSTKGLSLWLSLMALVAWNCFDRLGELLGESGRLLSLGNLPVLWTALVAMKVLHEFGHAYALRRFGAAVPEMGVMLLMMTPCAYVDASASWNLRDRRQRLVVGLAGMYVESFVAGIAALVWAGSQPGFVHDVAFDVVALAGIVTVLFNLNPLMKYDGYFVFSDLFGIFNLQQRAARFFGGWVGHLALGQPRPRHGYTAGERWLYGLYGPCAFVYRALLAFTLTGFVALEWPGAGLALGAVFAWSLLLRPLLLLLAWLWNGRSTRVVRVRSRLVAVAVFLVAPLLLGFLPISRSVVVPGILDPRTRESVRAPASGFLENLVARNGNSVVPGTQLCTLRNPELEMRRTRLVGELQAEQVSLDAIELDDSTQAAVHKARLGYLRTSVEEIDNRLRAMHVTATMAGTVAGAVDLDIDGRFLQEGEELFQIHSEHRFVRVLLTEQAVARARLEVGSEAEVRWTCRPEQGVRAVVREIQRSASRFDVPAPLTMLAGGDVWVHQRAAARAAAEEPYLHVLLEADSVPLQQRGTGLTASVRLPARTEFLGRWLHRRLLTFVNAWLMS